MKHAFFKKIPFMPAGPGTAGSGIMVTFAKTDAGRFTVTIQHRGQPRPATKRAKDGRMPPPAGPFWDVHEKILPQAPS